MISTARLQIILEKRNHIPHHVFLLILEYGVERMNMVEYIPKCMVLTQYYFIYQAFIRRSDDDVSFWDVLEEKCVDPERSLEVLAKCRCCKRHQINKPVVLGNELRQQSVAHYDHDEKQVLLNYICNCPCRHYARWIARTF